MAAEKENKYAQVWTVENAQPFFEEALKYARESDDCLCLQDAIANSGIPYSTFYYLADNHDVLERIKKDIMNEIVRRINRFALDRDNPAPSSPSIWRMKQLGERDHQFIDQNVNQKSETKIQVQSKDDLKEIKKLKERFESE